MTSTYPRRPASSSSRSKGPWGCLALIVLVLVVLGGGIACTAYSAYGTEATVTFTVTGLDDQISSSSGSISHKYLITTVRDAGQKIEVFKDTDSLLQGKFDSSDVWARFQTAGNGAIWTCPVNGFRIFFTSSYRNILDGCKLLHSGRDTGLGTPNLYPTPNGKAPVSMMLTGTAR